MKHRGKGKTNRPFASEIARARKKIRFLKIKLFLLITLPVAIVTIGNAVIREYVKIRVRRSAERVKADLMERHAKDEGTVPASPPPR